MNNDRVLVATHNGVFHVDEVTACAVIDLSYSETNRRATFTRTRDPKVIAAADIVVDVGGRFNPPTHFDHHQKDAPTRNDGMPYSSAGLVWMSFGRLAIMAVLKTSVAAEHQQYISSDTIDSIWSQMDAGAFLGIDRGDNGDFDREISAEEAAIVSAVNSFKPNWVTGPTSTDWDCNFEVAVFAVQVQLHQQVLKLFADMIALTSSEDSYKTAILDGRVATVASGALFPKQNVLDNPAYDKVALELFPDIDGTHRIRVVPRNTGTRAPRMNLPEAWAGLNGVDLAKVTGVEDATFCHKARFIAGAKSKEGAIALAKLALKELEI